MSVNGDALTGMFFEVTPHPCHSEHYFSYVEEPKPELVKYSGLVWINRYQSVSDDSSLLSYQLCDNEKSIEKYPFDQANYPPELREDGSVALN